MNHTLSNREKWLAIGVGAVLFVFANVFLFQRFSQQGARLRADIAAKTKQLQHMQSLTEELAFSEQRESWLQAKQPKLTNPDTAGVQLLNQIKDLARQHEVLLENPAIRLPERQPEYVAISVEVETKSSWKPLIAFLHDLQNPEKFIAVESANLKIDDSDQTKMRGRFKIARWYAPR
jgi:hypothetical protein